jgi:hypothetical protein
MAAVWFMAAERFRDSITLEARTLHLGRAGQMEWDRYKDIPVDAESLVLRFETKANATEHTLILRQKNVKLNWPVLLNGKSLGKLTPAEAAQDAVFSIAPGLLKEGENVLQVAAPPNLDDIEVGPVRLMAKSKAQAIGGAMLPVTVTEADTDKAIPCRLTLTHADGTLAALSAQPLNETTARSGVVYTARRRFPCRPASTSCMQVAALNGAWRRRN